MLVATLPVLSGCGLFGDTPRKPTPAPVAAPPATSEDVLKVYFQTMSALISNDPARQSDVFYEAEREYKKAPTTAAVLRYALAQMTPNHPGSNAANGKKLLETLLNNNPERLTPAERTFAGILLSQVAARLKIENEDRRAIATLEQSARTQASSDKRIIAQQADEIARLNRALTEAKQKLEAIKEIERSSSERSPPPPGNRDNSSETQSPPTGR